MGTFQVVDYGKLSNDSYYVIESKLELKGKMIENPNGHREHFHVFYFDVTTYENGKYHYNSNKFITVAFDESEHFKFMYHHIKDAFETKLQQIKNELIIVGELV